MADAAGIFEPAPEGPWEWIGNELIDPAGDTIARVRSDVLYCDSERLLVESVPGPRKFRARATTGDGRVFTLAQSGFTVNVLHALCDGRAYELRRTNIWRKERYIVGEQGIVAYVSPLISGKVQFRPGPAYASLPTVDAVFLSWGCVLVDSPVRRPRV
ncbi:hypothetical protein HCH15_03880 [Corynebacterium testudinoris]|uniref:Uncharacterized protein n=1 Tax=Corynebacterium testudinoris TaxID=136857 RepID=A0A0G3H7F5_9CORY|nr:hypothetical protein [Corynebacterium testudinoris]AKK09321.1 hypothetical protein CTEST_09480 [Corynebacterium testudinoris]MBX8995326.1 hypothetical protein [Corynebacterium testudinoris]